MTLLGGQPGMAQMEGKAQRKAYEAEALQVGLESKSAELERREALQDALAMQAVITGASGRVGGEGSPLAIRKADIARGAQDVSMIKAGSAARQATLIATGRRAEQTTLLKGLMKSGQSAASFGQVR